MPKRITSTGLKALLEDIRVPDSEIAQYLRPAADGPGAFNPTFEPDPELVEIPPLESALKIGNSWCRWRRRRRFDARVDAGERLPVIVSEGDSWFQFPFLIEDVIDHLGEDYLVWSCGAAGDTANNIVFQNPEYMEALEEQAGRVSAFLLSAAGNDVIGEDESGKPVLLRLLRQQGAVRKPAEELIDQAVLEEVLNKLHQSYSTVVTKVRTCFPDLPIIFHGYDYSLPYPNGQRDPRKPLLGRQG